MNKYHSLPCPVCGKSFGETDDIVVCPECGAPHHRACYRELGHCFLQENHAVGFAWQPPFLPKAESEVPVSPRSEPMLVGGAGADSSRPADYNGRYGQRGPAPQAAPPSAARQYQAQRAPNIDLEGEIDGVPVREVAQYLGQNAYYYLPRFQAMALTGRSMIPNFAALFFNFFYYFNRKMYKVGAAFLAMFVLSLIPSLILIYQNFPAVMDAFLSSGALAGANLITNNTLALVGNLLSYAYLFCCMASGFFANKLYYNFAMKNIRAIREEFKGRPEQDYVQALAIRGRTNKTAVIVVCGAIVLAYIAYEILLVTTYNNF